MKKQSGFTLIELVVAMAVLGLIMGAMVHLFGSTKGCQSQDRSKITFKVYCCCGPVIYIGTI